MPLPEQSYIQPVKATSDDPTVVAINKTNSLTNAVVAVPTQIVKNVASAAVPEALAVDGTFFRKAILLARKGVRTVNAGIVYLGVSSTNDTQPFELNPGDMWTIEAPMGEKYDLNDWYLDVVTAADGVVIVYS